MRVPIILLAGQAGAGKDATADMLVAHYGATKVAQSDPMKWLVHTLFRCVEADLWGPSERRATVAVRNPRCSFSGDSSVLTQWLCRLSADGTWRRHSLADLEQWLLNTPFQTLRDVLQTLGTEWGRHQDPDLWVDNAIRSARHLLGGNRMYHRFGGVVPAPGASTNLVVIPDGRFRNEILRVREVGGVTIRIDSPGAGLSGTAAQHASETALTGIPAGWFDYTLVNDQTLGLDGLRKQVDNMMRYIG